MKQEVRIKLDVSVTYSATHSPEKLAEIIERAVRQSFPNNYKFFHSLKFAEERHLYGFGRTRWTPILKSQKSR
jgi:hypothetical protein